MADPIDGLHHVTATAGAAQRNHDFYAGALGLRFVKRTVNFDDPGVYHLYFGDAVGSPGTAMTFFPREGAERGTVGAGQVALTQFAVPPGALGFWEARLPAMGARGVAREIVLGERRMVFEDPDGLRIALVEAEDARAPWPGGGIGHGEAIRGFHGVTLALHDGEDAARILGEVFGYRREGEEAAGTGRLVRWRAAGAAGVVDLHLDPDLPAGAPGPGTVHHVAFRVPDGAAQLAVRERMVAADLKVTPQIDRDYFLAIYARIPGGVLFEVATEGPGFTVDEPEAHLGRELRLPRQHEPRRAEIEAALPALDA